MAESRLAQSFKGYQERLGAPQTKNFCSWVYYLLQGNVMSAIQT